MRRTVVALAVGSVVGACVPLAGAADAGATQVFDLSSLKGVRVLPNSQRSLTSPSGTITAFPLNSPPIGGFAPRVIFGLTDEQDPDDISFESHMSTSPGGNTLPIGSPPRYFIATLDTGAQSHIVRYADAEVLNLDSANRLGNYFQEITGANGTESSDISDGLGIYMTGFGSASVSGGSTINVTGSLRGQSNTAILTTLPGSGLPNIIGSPMIAQHQAVIRNTQTKHLTVGGQTYRTPQVDFQPLNTALPADYYRLPLDVLSGNGVSPQPVFFPSLDNLNNWADNPVTPSFWASLFADVGGSMGSQQFLFDTGAEVTVLSQDTAQAAGFITSGPNPSTPDFFVEVLGVGGTAINVPGFYMDTLTLGNTGITFNNVPVIVLNLPDPRDFIGFVPGIIGMNLFTDRDLIVNGGTADPFVGISPQWMWKSPTGGNWSAPANWWLTVPNAIDAQANFYGAITSPQTINLDSGFTVGTIGFDNANRYTLAGAGVITMNSSVGPAQVNVFSGSHTISAPMTLATDTDFNIMQLAAKLTIPNDVSAAGVTIIKSGPGTLEMKNVRAAALNVSAGKLQLPLNGTNSSTSRVNALTINTTAGTTAKLEIADNRMVIDYTGASPAATIRQYLFNGYASGAWDGAGGIVSIQANATNFGIGYAENFSGATDFGGQPADATSILMRVTRFGDATLDGIVNLPDFNALASNFNGTDKFWYQGDFNYNGLVNLEDFNLLAGNFNLSAGPDGVVDPEDWAALAAVVPEPATLLFAGIPALLGLRGRRRR